MSVPHTTSPEWPEIPSSRFASMIRREPAGCRVVLIGLPDDTGVKLNGGRPGAKEGPTAFRSALAKYGTASPHGFDWPAVYDAGDVESGNDIHETHDRVTETAAALLDLGLFPIAIGGGHDLTYPFVRAVAQRHDPMSGVYFDAHLDVREEVGSGMPFRRLVEDCGVRALHVHGLDPFANTAEHTDWFLEHGGTIDAFGPDDDWAGGDLFVSLDLDVIDRAHAPGVSATNPSGWTPGLCERWVRAAGRSPRVRCFDIMELNPAFDIDGATARLAARMFLAFLRGFMEREGSA